MTPLEVRAQVCCSPAASKVAPETPASTTPDPVPPRCPASFAPQHFTVPPTAAQACLDPTARALAPTICGTSMGLADCTPLAAGPSWPASLAPQHHTDPATIA